MNSSGGSYANVMVLIGGVIFVVVVGFSVFLAVDATMLSEQTAAAMVIGKRHEPARMGYVTQIINNRSHVVPQMTPEAYRLELEIDQQRVEALVSREDYESVHQSQLVQATYRRGRLTGSLQVTEIRR